MELGRTFSLTTTGQVGGSGQATLAHLSSSWSESVISTTEKGEDQETEGRDRSFNSTEFDGYSFEGMSGANPTGQNVLEAAAKATIGRRDTSNDDSPGPKVAPGSPEETTL